MFAFILVVFFFFSDPQREDRWKNNDFSREEEEEDKEFELHEENDPLRDLSLLSCLLLVVQQKVFVVVNAKVCKVVMFDRFFVQHFPLFGVLFMGRRKTQKTLNIASLR